MPALSRISLAHHWAAAFCSAGIAVGGGLAMTVILGAVAMLAAAMRGVTPAHVPLLLTTDPSFPWFCTAAGVFTALLAGYITSRAGEGSVRHAIAAGVLTMVGHAAVVGLLGSPLVPTATAVYIGLTMPAVWMGYYLGCPVRCAT